MPSPNGVGCAFLSAPQNSTKARVNHFVSGQQASSSSGLFSPVAHSNLTTEDRAGFAGLGDTQWKTLVRLLEERKHLRMSVLRVHIFLNHGLLIQVLQII